jgi:hypothetical protein
MLKPGGAPQSEFPGNTFRACVKYGWVPRTWKRSRTVFLYKKGEVTAPENWRPIAITSCVYRIFASMISGFIQQNLHKPGKRKIFSLAQKGFVSGVQGCM